MTKNKKPVNWGKPGETGVTETGIPWRVPDTGPTRGDRIMQKIFRMKGTYAPIGARAIPARTAAEVRERIMRGHDLKYVAARVNLAPGEEIEGFISFDIGRNVPQPPLTGTRRPHMLLRKSWMSGDWDSMAGKLIIAIGHTYGIDDNDLRMTRIRIQTLVRTSHKIVILRSTSDATPKDRTPIAEYRHDEIGVRPGWRPYQNRPERVDIGFADGSWVGVERHPYAGIAGGTEGHPERDLLAELAGPPVTGGYPS